MPKPKISHRYPTPGEIQEVINDLEIIQGGGRVYAAVDPYEVISFCFPVDPTSFRDYDITSIADHQTGLYEVFYASPHARPLLLDEYAEEIEKYVAYVRSNLEEMYTGVELLDALISQADLENPRASDPELLEMLEDNFGVILAIVMGIYSLGSKRLFDVARRFVKLDEVGILQPLDGDEKKVVKDLLGEYREGALAETIREKLNSLDEEETSDSDVLKRKRKANQRDARAVDRLIYLNSACERAYRQKKLKNRHLFLYLSSARRSKRIFEMDEVHKALPLIHGKRYSFWRTSGQAFCYAVQKSADKDLEESSRQTIENLKGLQAFQDDFTKLEAGFSAERQSECKVCILEGGEVESCRWLGMCRRVREVEKAIRERQAQIDNLGLVSSVQKYQELLKARPGSGEQKEYLQLFKKVYDNSKKIADRALERMRILQRLSVTQSELPKMLPKGSEDGFQKGELEAPEKIKTKRPQLPSQAKIISPQYINIVKLILQSYSDDSMLSTERLDLLDRVYEEYLALDATMKGVDAEHELVRCFMFLSFFTEEGNKKAFDHACTQVTQQQFKNFRSEFYYLMYSAGWRLGYFSQTNDFTQRAVVEYPEDPRFPYALAANTFSWLTAERPPEPCPYTLAEVIDFTHKAVALYEADPERNGEFIAGNYNNLAYFHVFDENQACFDVTRAHAYLDKLVSVLERTKWQSRPEYFHTEALILFRDFENLQRAQGSAGDKKQLLLRSLDAVSMADKIDHDSLYGDLKRKIRHELRTLKAATPATTSTARNS